MFSFSFYLMKSEIIARRELIITSFLYSNSFKYISIQTIWLNICLRKKTFSAFYIHIYEFR